MTSVLSPGPVHVPAHKPNTEDEDMKLARQLQEQERAYFLLSQGGYSDEGGQETRSGYYSEGSDDMGGSAGSAEMGEAAGATTATAATEEVEEFDDEAFARRLQEEEQRAVMSRLIAAQLGMAGHGYSGEEEEQGADGEEANLEDDTDPDQMTYEQLTALGEVVGTEQVGVSRSTLEKLAEVTFVQTADAGEEQCVICRVEFEDGEKLKLLPCKHQYHGECIEQWLNINKKCPTCSHELDCGECK